MPTIDFKTIKKSVEAAINEGDNCIYPDEDMELDASVSVSPVAMPVVNETPVPVPEFLASIQKMADAEEEAQAQAKKIRLAAEAANDEAAFKSEDVAKTKIAATRSAFSHDAIQYALKRFSAKPLPTGAGDQYSCTSWLRSVSFTDVPPALLKTVSGDSLAAEGMVAKAIEKGWSPINVAGTDEFKANVFHQAVRMGVEISNYQPTQKDLDLLKKANVPIPVWVKTNEISISGPVAVNPVAAAAHVAEHPDQNIPSAEPESMDSAEPTALPGETLVDFGSAPYKHQKNESASYFVTTSDNFGKEKTVWGVDLERAVEEADCAIGDRVQLKQLGKIAVQINAPVMGADGKPTGETEPKTVNRNAWEIAILAQADPLAEQKPAPKASRPSSPSMSM